MFSLLINKRKLTYLLKTLSRYSKEIFLIKKYFNVVYCECKKILEIWCLLSDCENIYLAESVHDRHRRKSSLVAVVVSIPSSVVFHWQNSRYLPRVAIITASHNDLSPVRRNCCVIFQRTSRRTFPSCVRIVARFFGSKTSDSSSLRFGVTQNPTFR